MLQGLALRTGLGLLLGLLLRLVLLGLLLLGRIVLADQILLGLFLGTDAGSGLFLLLLDAILGGLLALFGGLDGSGTDVIQAVDLILLGTEIMNK